MTYRIDYYYNEESHAINMLREIEAENDFLTINYYKIDEGVKEPAKDGILLFEESDSYMTSLGQFEAIVSAYGERAAVIILSSSREILNVVRWMRKGASDYLWIGNFSGEILLSSIRGTLAFLDGGQGEIETDNNPPSWGDSYLKERVTVPQAASWESLQDNSYYDFALVSITISTDRYAVGRYSELSKEKIYSQIRQELEAEVKRFGGRIWLWNNGSALLAFHFGEAVNCAVLTSISFYNHFFLTCIKRLKLDELLKIKIALNWGNSIYHKSNTENITSDTLNSLIHLINNYASEDSLVITGDVYERLSARLKPSFKELGSFEGNRIFEYNMQLFF